MHDLADDRWLDPFPDCTLDHAIDLTPEKIFGIKPAVHVVVERFLSFPEHDQHVYVTIRLPLSGISPDNCFSFSLWFPHLLPHAPPPKPHLTTRFIIKSNFFENFSRVFIFISRIPVLRAENRVKSIRVPGRLRLL